MGVISDKMKDVFLEHPEIEEKFAEEGEELARMYDVEAAQELMEIAAKYDKDEVFTVFCDYFTECVNFWRETVKDICGVDIMYDLSAKRWRDEATGRFVPDPYVIIRTSEKSFEDALREKYRR